MSRRHRGEREAARCRRCAALAASALLVAACGRSSGPDAGAGDAPPTREVAESALLAGLDSAERLIRGERFDEAQAIAEALALRAARSWEVHELRGRIATAQAQRRALAGDEADAARLRGVAAEAYRRALELGPDDARLVHAAGLALLAADAVEEAIAALRRAAALDPDAAQYPLHLAQAQLRIGDFDGAEASLERALALSPEEPFALASRAEIARQRGDLAAALDLMRAARRLDPSNLALRVGEARLLRLADRPRDGLEMLLAVGEERWAQPSVVEEVALGWHALGEPRRAAEAWEACQRRHPGHLVALLRAAEAWFDAGDPVRADVLLREAALRGADPQRIAALRGRAAEGAP